MSILAVAEELMRFHAKGEKMPTLQRLEMVLTDADQNWYNTDDMIYAIIAAYGQLSTIIEIMNGDTEHDRMLELIDATFTVEF